MGQKELRREERDMEKIKIKYFTDIDKIEKIAKFKKIIIIDTRGVSTMYANDGGVIMAV